jgi:hypothetical protein
MSKLAQPSEIQSFPATVIMTAEEQQALDGFVAKEIGIMIGAFLIKDEVEALAREWTWTDEPALNEGFLRVLTDQVSHNNTLINLSGEEMQALTIKSKNTEYLGPHEQRFFIEAINMTTRQTLLTALVSDTKEADAHGEIAVILDSNELEQDVTAYYHPIISLEADLLKYGFELLAQGATTA